MRIDANGATGWTGESEDADENHDHGGSRNDAGDALPADFLHLNRGVDQERHQTSDARPDHERHERASKDPHHQPAGLRSQRTSQADLTPPLRDDERHERVHPGHREEQDDQHDRAKHEAQRVGHRPPLPVNLAQRSQPADTQRGIDRRRHFPESSCRQPRVRSDAKSEAHLVNRCRQQRMVDGGSVVVRGEILHHSDNLVPGFG